MSESSDPELDALAVRCGVGHAAAAVAVVDDHCTIFASLHRSKVDGRLWLLVIDRDLEGGDETAAPIAEDGYGTLLSDRTLVIGGAFNWRRWPSIHAAPTAGGSLTLFVVLRDLNSFSPAGPERAPIRRRPLPPDTPYPESLPDRTADHWLAVT